MKQHLLASTVLLAAMAVASAQDGGGNVYLPAVSGGQSASVGDPLPPGRLQYYRTAVEVNTAAQWQSLARIDPVIVERSDVRRPAPGVDRVTRAVTSPAAPRRRGHSGPRASWGGPEARRGSG